MALFQQYPSIRSPMPSLQQSAMTAPLMERGDPSKVSATTARPRTTWHTWHTAMSGVGEPNRDPIYIYIYRGSGIQRLSLKIQFAAGSWKHVNNYSISDHALLNKKKSILSASTHLKKTFLGGLSSQPRQLKVKQPDLSTAKRKSHQHTREHPGVAMISLKLLQPGHWF